MARTMTGPEQIKNDAARKGRKLVSSKWVERLTRFGYVVRGIVYAIPGLLAFELAIGARDGQAVSPTGAIQVIGSQPFGKVMLIAVAVGLGAYALWGMIRALFDPYRDGQDVDGLAARLGYGVSALGYATLVIATVQYLTGAAMNSNNPQDWSARLLAEPWGRIAVAVIGIGWMAGGLWQMYQGYKADFKKDFKLNEMSKPERTWSVRVGRFGLIARGVVFFLIGLFLAQSAVFVNPADAKGFDGTLLVLASKPYGAVLLGVVALGLVAFGLYSVLCARWMKVRVPARAG